MNRIAWVSLALLPLSGALWLLRPRIWVEEHDGARILRSPTGAQTISMLDGGPTGRYYDSAMLAAVYAPSLTPRIALLGLGGGEMLRVLRRIRPGAVLTAVDNDPAVIEIAEGKFGIARELRVDLVEADATQWVRLLAPQSWDAFVIDLYNDSEMVPLTAPFFAACHAALRPGGVLLVNIDPPSRAQAVMEEAARAGFAGWVDKTYAADGNVILVAKR